VTWDDDGIGWTVGVNNYNDAGDNWSYYSGSGQAQLNEILLWVGRQSSPIEDFEALGSPRGLGALAAAVNSRNELNDLHFALELQARADVAATNATINAVNAAIRNGDASVATTQVRQADGSTRTLVTGVYATINVGFEAGVADRAVASVARDSMQDMLDFYSRATNSPRIQIDLSIQERAVAAPSGGNWNRSNMATGLSQISGPGFTNVLFASSDIIDGGASRAGLGNRNGSGAVISARETLVSPGIMAHEIGHIINWGSPAVPHAPYPENIMYFIAQNPNRNTDVYQTIDVEYYNKLIKKTTPTPASGRGHGSGGL
jgi:hypothetical protein